MEKITHILVAFGVILMSAAASDARNTPCSGKKGGVAGCTASGKFMCKNGSVSASKRRCHR